MHFLAVELFFLRLGYYIIALYRWWYMYVCLREIFFVSRLIIVLYNFPFQIVL